MYRAYRESVGNEQARIATMAASQSLKVVLFLGTVRENRLGLRVAKFMKEQLEKSNHSVTLFDPLEMEFPLLTKPLFFYRGDDKAPDWLVQAGQWVKEADAYVVVSAEYNHSMPPALSNMIDHFPTGSFGYKPSAIVCYSPGMYGGVRAAMQLRAFLGEVGCLSVSNIFGIPEAHKALSEDGAPLNDHMVKGANKLIAQLDWHATAMRNHRQAFGIPQ